MLGPLLRVFLSWGISFLSELEQGRDIGLMHLVLLPWGWPYLDTVNGESMSCIAMYVF
jgi:hypothetical protein